MQNDNLQLLIKSAKQGKKNAFQELFNLKLDKIYNIAVRFLLNEKTAEIITQNIFIEAWEKIEFLPDGQSFETWLKSLAIYKLLDELKTSKITNKLIEDNLITTNDAEIVCSDKLENKILCLPEKERISFILHDIEKYTYDEIVNFNEDISKDEIKLMVRKARKSLISYDKYE